MNDHLPSSSQAEADGPLAAQRDERLLRLPEVLAQCGMCRSSLYTAIQKGDFPSPYKNNSTSVWLKSEVDAWLASLIRRQRAQRPPHRRRASDK